MDKQAAITYIHQNLDENVDQEEIVEALCAQLKAPAELISRFVKQVAESYSPVRPQPETAVEPVAIPPHFAPRPVSDDIPGWIIAMEAAIARGEGPTPTKEPIFPDAGISEIIAPENGPIEVTQPELDFDLETLEHTVLEYLKKQRRHNDIVELVCQQTGWHWNKAQRFVARVQTNNHASLHQRQNWLIVFIGVIIVLAGFGAVAWGSSMIWSFISAFDPASSSNSVSLEWAVYGGSIAVTGLGMMIGGGFGISRALANR